MIKKYSEFVLESLDLLLESNVIYSDKLRRALTKIESPIAKKLLDIENKDFPVQSNYFDITKDKNDSLNFISDRKAQEILGEVKELYRFIGSGGGWLKHKSSNSHLFEKLGYTYEEGTEPYKPNSRDVGTVIAKVTSEQSGKVYAWVKWNDNVTNDFLGEGVYNQDKLRLIDMVSELMKKVWSNNRQDIRVGRGVRALIRVVGETFTDKEYEDFVNLFKSTIDKMNDKFSYFDIVNGDYIHYWYNRNRYYESKGTLGSSCMASADESWLKIYTANPEQVSLVILKSQDDDTKIVGRALLWTLVDGKKFLDRIYTINDSDVNLFRDFAKEKGWYVKYNNSSSDSGRCIAPDGSYISLELVVHLTKKNYRDYPYLDTLKYYKEGTGILSNEKLDDAITLEDTSGGYIGNECSYCGGSGRLECNECYGRGEYTCNDCDGDGELECENCNGSGEIGDSECEECNGKGNIECSRCDGEGNIECGECGGSGEISCYECN